MKSIRRVVVAQNSNNQSTVIQDRSFTEASYYLSGVKDATFVNLWATHQIPADLNPEPDPTTEDIPFLPSANGSIFRICDIPPNSVLMRHLDEISLNGATLTPQQKALKHPLMHIHRPPTLAYAIVLNGEVTLVLDQEETILRTGDVVIECSSHHAWSNHTEIVCRMAFVLIGAK